MPKYIDQHKMNPLTAQQLKEAQKSPKDKFGVMHHDILYNKSEDRIFCVLDAPSKEAVENHHKAIGLKCDWIHEVESTRTG